MAVLQHIIGTLLCTSSKLLTPPKMEVSYLDPQCCSARRASWAGLPQVEVLCEYRAGGLVSAAAEYSPRSACGMGTHQQPRGIVSSGWKEDCSCLALAWLLSIGFRPEEVLCPRVCWLSSFPLQAAWAAQVARALSSGTSHWSLTVRPVVNVSS